MKTLKNVTTEIKKNETEKTTYADLSESCLNMVPKGGLNVSEMRDRVNVLGKIKAANGKINLEDAEAQVLKNCVSQTSWTIIHEEVLQFCDAVEKM